MDRLEKFEQALVTILKEYEVLGEELKKLRHEGKMKTTKFRELLGKKLVYSMIIASFWPVVKPFWGKNSRGVPRLRPLTKPISHSR